MERAAFVIYLVILVMSPLLFGAVHTYAYTFMSLGILVASLLVIFGSMKKDPNDGTFCFTFPATSFNLLFIALSAYLIFQLLPLPQSIVRVLSPEGWVVAQKSLSASTLPNPGGQIEGWLSITPYSYPVRMSLIRWITYGLFFLGFIQSLSSQKRIETAVFVILIACCFIALYGMVETYSGSERVWWYKKTSRRLGLMGLSGTYINRNHFAGLMEMGLLLAVTYVGALGRRSRRSTSATLKDSFRARISRFLAGEQRFNKRLLILFSGVVIGVCLILSASRGGIIAAAGAMLFTGTFFIFRKNLRKQGAIILFLFLITSVYSIHIGVEHTVGRFEHMGESFETRFRFAQKALNLFEDYQLTGVGIGNFQYAYPKYQAKEDIRWFIRHAHNDWAQFLAEAGIAGLVLFLTGISFYLYKTLKLWTRRKDPLSLCLGIAPLGAMTAIAIHSFSDFNLHIPANFLMLAAIAGIGFSALHLKKHRSPNKSLMRYHAFPFNPKGILVLIMVLGVIGWSGYWTIRHFVAECYSNTVTHYLTLNRDQNPPLEEVKQAIKWDSLNAAYWWKLAWGLKRNMREASVNLQETARDRDNRRMEIIEAIERAIKLNPYKSEYHYQLGVEYFRLGRMPDFHERWLPATDRSMERAVYFANDYNPSFHEILGNYWVIRTKTIGPGNPQWDTAWTKAWWHYRKAKTFRSELEVKRLMERIEKHHFKYYPDKYFFEQTLEQIK